MFNEEHSLSITWIPTEKKRNFYNVAYERMEKLWDRQEHMCKVSQRALRAQLLYLQSWKNAASVYMPNKIEREKFANNFIFRKLWHSQRVSKLKLFKRCAFNIWSRKNIEILSVGKYVKV